MLSEKNWQIVKDHLWGPIGSCIIHIFVVIALVLFVQIAMDQDTDVVQVMVIESSQMELDEIEKELDDIKDLQEPNLDDIFVMDIPMEVPDTETVEPQSEEIDFTDLELLSDIESPVTMSGLMAGRTKIGRSNALNKYGGKHGQSAEAAVRKALEWLKRNQAPNGSWSHGGKMPMGLTGLGLLTFLAHGETPAAEKYGPTVEKAIRFLAGQCDGSGRFIIRNTVGHSSAYEHAIATYAICEAYGMTRIPTLKSVMTRNLDVIIKGQQNGGSWDYAFAKKARTDLSVSGWMAQALKAGYIAGAENEGLKGALEKAVKGIEIHYLKDAESFRYSSSSGRFNQGLTGAGVLCLQLLGKANSVTVNRGLHTLEESSADYGSKALGWPMYAWYYITQAKFHAGGFHWSKWNPKIATSLVRSQNKNGSWLSPGSEKSRGPVYCTTMAALTLQVYYRFLPTYKATAIQPAEVDTSTDGDVEIGVSEG